MTPITNQITYYLSGPMHGIPLQNYPAFQAACDNLRSAGYRILSPHEKDTSATAAESVSWEAHLREDLTLLLSSCGGVILLPGWPTSAGARLELTVALALSMPIYFYEGQRLRSMQTGTSFQACG